MTFPKWEVLGGGWPQSLLALSWPTELGGRGGIDGSVSSLEPGRTQAGLSLGREQR